MWLCCQCRKANPDPIVAPEEDLQDMELIETPHCDTIEELAAFLQIPQEKTIKAVAFNIDGKKTVLCMVRGDHEVNDVAVQNLVGGDEIGPATEEELKAHGLVPGYMSPLTADEPDNETFFVIVDPTAMNLYNGVTGANKAGYHYKNVTPKRDFKNVTVATIRLIDERDTCPECGGKIEIVHGIEVGQVFELGTKYAESLHATFLDKDGKARPFYMGCYGIGVTRTMAAAIEQFHDDHGIMWPVNIAPYEVVVLPVNTKDEELMAVANDFTINLAVIMAKRS